MPDAASALNETLAAPATGGEFIHRPREADGGGRSARTVAVLVAPVLPNDGRRSVRAWTPSVRVRSTASLVVVVHAPPLRA